MNYEYKEKQTKNGLCIAIRDRVENSLFEIDIKGNNVQMVTYVHNDKTTHFKLPLELFEKMYKDLIESK